MSVASLVALMREPNVLELPYEWLNKFKNLAAVKPARLLQEYSTVNQYYREQIECWGGAGSVIASQCSRLIITA